jgi:hypothetical protein
MPLQRKEIITQYMLALVAAALIAIWPLPGTMAFRNLLYVTGLACICYLARIQAWPAQRIIARNHLPVLLFFGWLLLHFAFFANDRPAQYRELTGFWLRCLTAFILGIGLGATFTSVNDSLEQRAVNGRSTVILFASLFGTLLIYLLRYSYEVIISGTLIHTDFFMTPFKGKPQIVIFIAILLTGIFAAFPENLKTKRNKVIAAGSILTILCCLFVLYTANTKNGFLIFLALAIAFLLKSIRGRITYKKALLSVMVLCVVVAFLYRHVQLNPAWNVIIPDAKAGLNIEGNTYWKNWVTEPLPFNELGVPVNQSAYLRTAWFRAAIELISENPQGYGLMSYSFSYLAKQKWPEFYSRENDHMVATHSGWTDLTLALGLPALLLVQYSLWRSFFRARRLPGYWHRYIRWTVPTIAFAYLTVEVSYDVFFELLFLYLGFFAELTGTSTETPNVLVASSGDTAI